MDRSVRRDIEKRYKKLHKQFNGVASGKISCYVCEQCEQITKTREVADGHVPMGIECPHCHANAMCVTEMDAAPNIPVTYEWYRPTLDELTALAEEHLFTVNYVLNGGLLRRPCSKD